MISVVFGYRLYVLQIKNGKKYELLSNKNKIRIINVVPNRGIILDRNGIELAVNVVSYLLISSGHRKEISWEEVEYYALKNNIVAFYKRSYPFSSICSHILGYTRREINKQIGISGVEYTYNHLLEGTSGKIEREVNSKQHIVSELSSVLPKDGQNVQLTIDINLQEKVAELFQYHKGSVVVINAKNGEILALYSSPSYDNNLFTSTLSQNTWQSLNVDSLPLVNRALSYQIPPASVFKVIVALAALQDGIISSEDKFFCKGYIEIGNRKLRCWKSDGHGHVSLSEAIASSCNVYFYKIGRTINVNSLIEMAKKFGIGNGPLMENFKEEASGLLPDRSWYWPEWKRNDTLNLVIGHGYVLTTPLQLAVLAARIATCKAVMPYIEMNRKEATFSDIDISGVHLNVVQQAMFNVVNSRIGTAYLPRGRRIAGKTGTSEVDHKGSTHKLFIAYNSSHYAISVFIEHGKSPRQDCLIAYKIFDYIGKIYGTVNKIM